MTFKRWMAENEQREGDGFIWNPEFKWPEGTLQKSRGLTKELSQEVVFFVEEQPYFVQFTEWGAHATTIDFGPGWGEGEGSYKLTGKGTPFSVLGKVIEAIRQYVAVVKPSTLHGTFSEKRLADIFNAKLMRALGGRFQPRPNDWSDGQKQGREYYWTAV